MVESVTETSVSGWDGETTDFDGEAAGVEKEAVTEHASDSSTTDIEEAPAPQPVELFDLSDDLSEQSAVAMFDMDEETVEATSSDDVTVPEDIEEPSDVVAASPTQAENESAIPGSDQHAASADDEIFEQVMGSSRADDIPVGRRLTPGSIPLPPQLAEEQARRERAAASPPVDARRRRHSLPDTGRPSRRHEGGALGAGRSGADGLVGAHEGRLGGRGGVGHPSRYGRGPPGACPRVR